MGVDLASYRARIGCFQNPTPRSVRCWSQASALLVGVILAQIWDKVTGDGQGEVGRSALDGLLPTSHQTEVQTYQLHCHPQSRCCFMMSCLLVWFMTLCKLLLQAGDIEQNPGPTLRETDTDETEEQIIKTRKNDDGLLELDLSGRKMSSLPDQVFQQNDIQVLNFQRNIIKVIPMDIGLLFQLRYLDISCNKLSHLPDSISSLSNLEELNISGNTIQVFPKGMENMQALKVLIYRNNSLVTIPEQVFSFRSIEELDVSDNELTEVSPLIGNLLSLKVLNLRWNQSLQTLPQELCDQLSDLEELNLSVCDLGYLPENIGNLKKLRILQSSCNRISSLPESVFKSLDNLEELTLCDNSITEIPESISNLKKLKHIKVPDNQLVRLPSSIVELTELQTLDVACNSITSLPHNFEDLVKIVHLNLKHNQISLVPFLKHGAFPALQEIHLTGNPIQLSESRLLTGFCEKRRATVCVDHRQYVHLITDKDEWYYERMKGKLVISLSQGYEINATDLYEDHIDLSDAGLKTLPEFFDIHHPSDILFSHNRIKAFSVSSPVVWPSRLTHLDLSHNLLSALPEEIHLLSNLRILNVSHNKLQSIPPGVYILLSLKIFNMSYNSVQQLPATKFPNLENLDLSYNKFQKVPEGVLHTQSLTYLNLLENKIASLPIDIARLTNLNTLCCGIKRPQNLSHVSVLKTLPWKNTEWTVNIKCNDNPTSTRTEAHFIARIDAGYLQVLIDTKEVTEGEFDENLQCGLSHICKIDWLKDIIREVDLSNCSIQDLPEHIFYFPKLTTLDVSNNRLSGLPSKLVRLQSLQVLNVSNCSLTILPDSIGEFPSLTRLDISTNNLKVLPNSISHLLTLEHLSLHECGCHQVEFLSHLTLKYVEVDLVQLISIRISCLDELSAAGTTIRLKQDRMVTGNVISFHEGFVFGITPYSLRQGDMQIINRSVISIDELRGPVLKISPSSVNSSESSPSHEKDSQPLTSISISDFQNPDIPNHLLSILCTQNLQVLKVSNCSLTVLPESTGEFPSLTSLDLSKNQLKGLPNSISHLSTLEVLNVSDCSLTVLPDSLVNLQSLTSLDISGNPLKALSSTILHISALKALQVSKCSLAALPDSIGEFQSLTSLDISSNCLKALPNSMSQLCTLEHLSLHYCGCHQVEFLSHLTLKHVDVDLLQLISIRTSCLDELSAAGTTFSLKLGKNQYATKVVLVSILKGSVFEITPSAIRIGSYKTDLSHENDSQPLTSITINDFQNPDISNLLFSILCTQNLQALNVSNCSLTALPDSIGDFPSLTSLDLSKNQLKDLPYSISHLSALKVLNVSNCSLTALPDSIGDFPSLTSLDLSKNQLKDLPYSISHLSALKVLNVSNCSLTALPDSIGDFPSLTSLDLSQNQLKDLPDSISHLSTLEVLNVSNCSLTALPDSLGNLQLLTNLQISGNPLKALPSTILQMSALKVLDVSNCSLTALPDSIGDFHSLTSLDISRNCLKALPNSMSLLSTLEHLTLYECGCYQVEFLSHLTLKHVEVDLLQLISIRINCLDELSAARTTFCLKMVKNQWPTEVVSILKGPVFEITPSAITIDSFKTDLSHENDSQPLTSITISDFQNQDIPNLLFSILCTQNLQALKVSNCSLTVLPDSIGDFPSLRSLDLSKNQLKDLPNSISHLSTLKVLNVSDCSLTALPESLGNLQSLTSMDISRNPLKTLPITILHIPTLKVLNVSNCIHNVLIALPDSIELFPQTKANRTQQISNLISLDVSNNKSKTFSGELASMLSLTEFNVSLNPVTMAKISSLQRLTMFHCGCYQMYFLSELKQLKVLTVDFWQLVSIQRRIAEKLPDSVQIRVCLDNKGSQEMFLKYERYYIESYRVSLQELQHGVIKLQFCHDQLEIIPPDDFRYNGDIIKMELDGSYINYDITLNLSILHTLQELILTFRNLDAGLKGIELPVNLTRLNMSLGRYNTSSIWVHHHGISDDDFSKIICQQSALQELTLSKCGLYYVSEDIGQLVNLTHLDLSRNRIEDLPDELCNITTIKWLSLQHNKLSSLPERIGNLLPLEYLDVSFNKLASIPDSFRQLSSLRDLRLSQCGCCHLAFLDEFAEIKILQVDFWQLLSIPQHTLMQLPGLLKLVISTGTFEYDPLFQRIADCDVTVDLDSLKQGQLNFNNLNINSLLTPPHSFIRRLSRSIVGYSSDIQVPPSVHLNANSSPEHVSTYLLDVVKCLNLSHNKLRGIPKALYLLGNLTHLDISNNIITALPENLFSLQKLCLLQHLDLSHNELREIPEALSLLSNLSHLDISNNIITGLPRGLVALQEIKSFYINRNKILWKRFIDLTFYKKLKHVKFDLIDYPPLDNLPSSLISVTVTLCDSQINHIADIDWDIQTSTKPHKYFDFVVRSLQGKAPDTVMLSSSDMHTISPIVLSLPHVSERVHSLLLSDNSISEVPSDMFKLLQLRHLDLSRNNISLIPGNIWKLPNLSYLDVSSNKIKEITEEISFAKRLTTLLAQGNELTKLPQSICTLPLLEELCVFSNDIKICRTPSVLSMITLKHIKIDLADIVTWESHITCSESLQMHCYYQNKSVTVISAKMFFEQMSRITMLLQESDKQISINLAGFGLVAFPGPIISHPNVEAIDLSQNEIRYIPEEVSKLHQLQKIILSQNCIQHFPQYLNLCTSLKHLDLYLNAIQNLPDDIGEMKQIQYLNLSSNSLKCLPMSIGNLQQLEELVLEYNQIEILPDSIGTLEKLSILRLSANCLRAVPSSLGNLLCLKQIDLSNNRLDSIPDVVGSLKNVVSIDISGNSLSTLPSSICCCYSLESMKLSSNMLSQLPDNIDQLENLTLLQASMNRLSVIPSSICRLQHLQTLDVSVNNITELPGDLGDLSSLTALNIGSNHLKELPESFTKLVNLTCVDISSNDLKAIPEEMFEFVNMTEFNIAGNKIETLPNTICELQNLEYLSIEENNIRVLPTQFGKLHKLRHFGKEQILDNPMEQPPIEVFEQGMEGVVAYFEELNLSKAIEVPRVKALLLGEVAAGKTSLCNAIRLGKSNLTDIADRTAGIEVHPTRLQDSIQVLMHDFGGHKIYHLTHQFFFSNAALYLIVVDLKAFKRSSFAAAVKYWLNVIKARIDSKPVLRIVGTHIDLCDPGEIKEKAELIMKKMKQIEKIEIETLNEHLSDIDRALNKAGTPCSDWCYSLEGFDTQSLRKRRKFIEHLIDNRPIFPEHIDLVSCGFSLDGIKQLIENIVTSCQDYKLFPRRILPKSWFELELAIKSKKQDGNLRYLSMDHVQKIAKEKANLTPARLTRALKYLHEIGEIVHFSDSPQLSNFVFHKPQWLMDVFKLVYKPVERFDERFASISDADLKDMVKDFSSRGTVSEKMIRCLWKQMNLSKQEESMLICLLQKFYLCFQIPTTENADPHIPVSRVYHFPWLLKASAPRLFRQCWKQKISSDEEVLMVVFQLQNYCPVGLFETLSVKLNKYIICREDWQCGLIAVSKVGENKILVHLKPKQSSEEIVISVRTQSKDLKEAWAVMVLIINATKELLQQWPGVLYCVRVVCPHCLKKGEDKPHRFSGAVLDKAPGGTEWCPKTMEKIDPRLIHPEISPAWWQQRRKRALDECGKSPAPEEVMMEKQPRYSEQEPDISVRNNTTVHATCVPSDCNAQNYDDTENAWERFRSMALDMQPQGEGNRLAIHLMESGLKLRPDVPKDGNCLFYAVSDQLVRTGSTVISHSQLRQDVVGYLSKHPHNEHGDHLRAFVPNEDWEDYLQQMSRDGVWGDHIVLQAMASMLGRDIRIVSSIDAENYTTILSPMGNQQVTTGPPLLLGHYAENHYASLDVCQGSAVLLISDEYGTSKGGISTINHQLAQLLRRFGAVVYCTVLWVTTKDEEDARKDGVHLIRPSVQAGDARNPSLDWLTYDHRIRYPNLPKDVGYIVGHGAVTDKAAENIKNSRYPQAKLYTFNHTIPEDTEHYKGGRRAIKAWEKETDLLKIADVADAVFSVGRRIYNHFETMYKGDKKPKAHHLFLPKPSKTFENTHVKSGGEQKVVLSIGRVKNAEQLKGHDLAARTMGQVAEIINNVRWRVRGINEDDFEKSKKILEDNLQSGRLKPTLQPYGTQKEISDDMKMAHLVLMPSRSEPFGLVGLEAIAAGIPVLISSQSGLADLIKELIKKGKCHPDLRHRIVETSVNVDDLDTDARKWTEKVVDTLRWNDEEFQKAALFKQQLQESMYWEESHQIFLQACGITNALSS
ncbi:uncharacterized protein LOC144878523 [Branchiostoma floridae x Branchiostoma japonicum]